MITRTNEALGKLSGWLVIFMVLVTFLVVVLRYVFEMGWVWMQEAVLYAHATVFLLGAGYALLRDAHVRVDVLYRGASPRRRAWIDLLGTVFLLLPTCGVLLVEATPFVIDSWRVFEGSKDGGGLEAVFLLKTLLPLFCLVVAAQGLVLARRALQVLRGSPT